MPVTYEELVAKANQHAKNLQVEEVERNCFNYKISLKNAGIYLFLNFLKI
jgi:hypothetical protein